MPNQPAPPARLVEHRATLLSALTAGLVLAGGWAFDAQLADQARHEQRLAAVSQLGAVRARVEGVINHNLGLVRGLIAFTASNPGITQGEFAAIAREVLAQRSQMRNVALARDMVITHIYPVDGNEAALGLDYRANPAQRAAALLARDTGSLVVAGPIDLVQGGSGFVGRAPIHVRNSDGSYFWGLAATVIDTDTFYEEAGLLDDGSMLRLALRGRDARGESGDVFFGEPEIFRRDPVTATVSLPYGSWQLGAEPQGGWLSSHPNAWQVRTAVLTIALLAAMLTFARARSADERRAGERKLATARATLAAAIEQTPAAILLADAPDGRLRTANTAALVLRRNPTAPLEHVPLAGYLEHWDLRRADGSPLDVEQLPLVAALREGVGSAGVEMIVTLGSGEQRWMMAGAAPVHSPQGGIEAAVMVLSDITDIKEAEDQVRYRANFDPLTGLPNRSFFLEKLEDSIARSRRTKAMIALMYIDLDRFKNVNDTLGHDVGDLLLKEAARRIEATVRSTDTVARLGGDEFTVILNDLAQEDNVTVIADNITSEMARPFRILQHTIYSGASIGITLCPADGLEPQGLLKNADMAMYQAKDQGRNNFQYFTRAMTERAQRFVSIEKDLRRSLERGDFRLQYQPICRVADRSVVGIEALLRWQHPERGWTAPEQFISVAEETGMIIDLGEWVLRKACQDLAGRGLGSTEDECYLSVNVSSRQFRGGFGRRVVQRILEDSRFSPRRLQFEITESLLLDEDERTQRSLHDFRQLGIRLALDDFGTGFSSLGYLRKFPVGIIKIDRSFINGLGVEETDTHLVRAIIAMARGLGLSTVAEGVESEDQFRLLAEYGCEFAQGFFIGRPVDLDELEVPAPR